MMFDPAKEQFELTARPIKLRDSQGVELKVVGEEDQAQVLFDVEVVDAPQGCGITARALRSGQPNGLVGAQSGGTIDAPPPAATVARVGLGAGDEESQRLGDQVEPAVIDVAAIEKIERSRFPSQLIEQSHIVDLPAGHINIGR